MSVQSATARQARGVQGCRMAARAQTENGVLTGNYHPSCAEGIDALWCRAQTASCGPIDVVDVFSGCGGMSVGFRAFNGVVPTYRLALAVDIDADCNRSYASNHCLEPRALDVAELAVDMQACRDLISSARSSDSRHLVLIGCAPCQGFSSHRNAAGAHDERNSLFVSFAKIAAAVDADAVVVENVPEILTDRHWPVVEQARRILSEGGYFSSIAVHDLARFGVPQHRYRAVLVAMRRPFRIPHTPRRSSYRTVRHAIGHLPEIAPGEVCGTDSMHFTARHRASTVRTIRQIPVDGGSRPQHVGPDCLRRAHERQGRAAYEDVYGRLAWDHPAITITASARNPASGRYVHPEQNRGLSIREAALLQSFPSDYAFAGSLDSCFRQIGNAVPPIFATALAAQIRDRLESPAARQHDPGIVSPLGSSFSRMIPALKAGYREMEQPPEIARPVD